MAKVDAAPLIAVIGGSGLYSLIEKGEETALATPYGVTSSPIVVGQLAGRQVAFLTRHGVGHTLPPHQIPYRANIWALARLGARALITSSAVGGLAPDLRPGSFVVPDQLIDATGSSRASTFFDGSRVEHLASAEPFDSSLRQLAVRSLATLGVTVEPVGTCVVIPGPRFSTRAESRMWAALGGTTVNMTLEPETTLARELGLGVVNLSFVTDSDAAVPEGHQDAVSAALVLQRLKDAQPVIRRAVEMVVAAIPADYRAEGGLSREAVATVLHRRTG